MSIFPDIVPAVQMGGAYVARRLIQGNPPGPLSREPVSHYSRKLPGVPTREITYGHVEEVLESTTIIVRSAQWRYNVRPRETRP